MCVAYQNQYEEIDYFQLSSEDMDLVGTNQQLRNAIVGSDQLEITGDLGEGKGFSNKSNCVYVLCTSIFVCIFVCIYMCLCVCVFVCTCVCVCVCVCVMCG